MAKIISFYSFRDGTGKSTILANVAAALATKYQKKVAVIDTNFAAPGLHYFFNSDNINISSYLNDFLNRETDIIYPYNVSLDKNAPEIKIKLIPASHKLGDMIKIMTKKDDHNIDEYKYQEIDYEYLCQGLKSIIKKQDNSENEIDYLLVDCSPGIQTANLLTMSISNMIFLVCRDNKQDRTERLEILPVIKRLGISDANIKLIINQVIDQEKLKEKFKQDPDHILPESQQLREFSASTDNNPTLLFYLAENSDEWSKKIQEIAEKIVNPQ